MANGAQVCGHSMGGAVAHLSALWLLTEHLRPAQSTALAATMPFSAAAPPGADEGLCLVAPSAPSQGPSTAPSQPGAARKPLIVSVGFGAPLSASSGVSDFVSENGLAQHFLTVVNRGDCVPGAFLFAQSAETLIQSYSKGADSLTNLARLSEAIQQVTRPNVLVEAIRPLFVEPHAMACHAMACRWHAMPMPCRAALGTSIIVEAVGFSSSPLDFRALHVCRARGREPRRSGY